MAETLLDKASYSLLRTNPKLTGNVKLVSNGNDLYLESFSSNSQLSSSSFKAFKIDGTQTYDIDVYNFFQRGKFPTDLAYEVFQEFQDVSVLSSYNRQYEMFYSAGTRSVASDAYSENLGMLAPLWLNQKIPNYFVIFRLDNPSAVNNTDATAPNEDEVLAQTPEKFKEFVLQNCTAIKTFDLSENSKLGAYIRRYRNKEGFPKAPLTVSWRKDEPITWNGISYKKGGFTSSGSFSYDGLIAQDATIIQNEYFFTQGFERNGILLANLINFEFLFSDPDAEDYSINRYFGLYVNEIEEGLFDISGEGFYKNTEKTQLPKIKTITEVSQYLNTPFELTNRNGILLFLDPTKTTEITGLPTPQRVSETDSIFYVKDKDDQFHTIKKGSRWGTNQIRLFDKKIDISKLAGYKNPDTFANAQVINKAGSANSYVKVLGELPVGTTLKFYDGPNLIGQVAANESLTNGPGTSFEAFFNPNGTPEEIARAIRKAVSFGINIDKRFFIATINKDTVYFTSRFFGSRFNRLKLNINWSEYSQIEGNLVSYPETSFQNETTNFVGGNDKTNSLLKVAAGDQLRFVKGNYVKTKAGYALISDWVPYLEEPIFDGNGNQLGYTDVDKYVIVTVDDNQIDLTRSGQVSLYSDYRPSFGRFSFFEVRDFDFDFYSDLYSELGELNYEIAEYNQSDGISTGVTGVTGVPSTSYFGVSEWEDIREFYDSGGFSNLIGLLKESDPDVTFDIAISSEYQRLEENYLKEQAVASRVIPYINKWGWYNGGTDVRNHPYRLNLSMAFGTDNFAPSKWATSRSPQGFSHEWYYLSEFPPYFTDDAIKSSWSYFDNAPSDNAIDSNGNIVPGTFQRTDINYFNEYFITDRFTTGGTINLINRQLRYGRFTGGDRENFAEAFLRGVRVIIKPKSNGEEKPNFNAKRLSYIRDARFNDYRFSVMLVPNAPDKPKNQIKFIKNEKWKTVTMLIFVSFDNDCINGGAPIIDRTSLYSMKSSIETLSDCSPYELTGGSYSYKNSVMQGSISFSSSQWEPAVNAYLIQGIPDVFGNPTRFIRDITIGADGQFNNIKFQVGGFEYEISGISRILNDNQLYATTITKTPLPSGTVIPITLPDPTVPAISLKRATYNIVGGGFNEYLQTLDNVSFAAILGAVNDGNPNIIYETIDKNGKQKLNSDGSLSMTFAVELRAQDDILKSTYIGVLPDPNKPTVFNLTDIIGYDLSLQRKPRINPIGRHSGWYEPISRQVLFYKDPYSNIDFTTSYTGSTGNTGSTAYSNVPDEAYKFKVFNLCRYANAEFNSTYANFGLLRNFFYHKVNQEDPSSVLELSTDSAYLSLYPLINEVGIDYKDFYIFSSNWEPGYFIKSIDKNKIQSIIGTRSMTEKKSFFGSKYLKVPQQITLETFVPSEFFRDAINDPSLIDGTFMYEEDQANIRFYLFIQKRLTQYLFDQIKPKFEEYVNPDFGFGNTETLDDDVNQYIEKNILKLYKVGSVNFYVRNSRENIPPTYTTAELTNTEKSSAGLSIENNVSSKILNTNPFDLRLIYNKRTGFSESFGFSVTLVKK
jgi:hypothetical protein